jgi:hypothetical protein
MRFSIYIEQATAPLTGMEALEKYFLLGGGGGGPQELAKTASIKRDTNVITLVLLSEIHGRTLQFPFCVVYVSVHLT